MKRATLVICLAAILLLALAVPAFAAPDGSSGTVYGKAVLAPYAIVVSGGGTDPGNPLTYQGELNVGPWAEEMYGSQVSVQNVGTQDAQIKITADQLPTAGSNVWGLSSHIAGADVAGWCFEGPTSDAYVLQESDPAYNDWSVLAPNLAAGNSTWFDSYFHFPMATSSSADHYMSATISAAAPN